MRKFGRASEPAFGDEIDAAFWAWNVALPVPSEGNGPLNDHTPPNPLPIFTYDQIIQALRTSGTMEATGTPAVNDHITDQRTWSWGTAGDIVYEVDAATMSAFERGRIDLAFEVWDDLINVNIRNDQTSGDAGGPTRFTTVSYVASGTNATRAFYSIDTGTANGNNNGYGTVDNTINTGTFNLGRNFNGGEFDGLDGAGNADNGVFDLTLFARRGFETILHEAGHGLGLSHPGYYNNGHVSIADGTRFDQDNRRNTIMSYRAEDAGDNSNADWNGLFAATPMIYDIAAVQTMYGADTTTRTGATTYGFFNNSGRAVFDFSTTLGSVFAIYDAGGIDTIDASLFTGNNVINLWPGTISSIGQAGGNTGGAMLENIGIAFNTVIENAIGGSGDDVLWGNDAHNLLDQRGGGGSARGFGGQDTMIAGPGGEQFDGGDGVDTIDYSRSTSGVDIVFGKVGGGWGSGDSFIDVENIIGTEFDDSAAMDGDDNRIEGRGGNDDLDGGGGIDSLYGGFGNDILTGGSGRWVGDLFFLGDWIDGGDGWDIAAFDTAVTIDLRPGGVHGGEAQEDTFVSIEQFNGGAERDFFYGGNLNDWFQGGADGDYLNGGAGSDTASYADKTFGITVQMSFNNMEAGDEFKHPNEVAGRTDGKVSPADGTWIDTLISIENIEGTNFDDLFLGDERANTFWGLAGNDHFEGDADGTPQGSWDDMYGGIGNDSFVVGVNDLANGGQGSDVATFVGGALYLNFDTFNFTIGGTPIHVQDIETYIGTDLSDTVIGASYGETIDLGAGGVDFANGRGGNDFLYTSDGFDTLIGGADFDTIVLHRSMMASWQTGELDSAIAETWESWEAIQGASGVDIIRTNDWGFAVELRGGAGDDILATGPGQVISDTLRGEAGNDSLNGGAGADIMSGGVGDDTYFVDDFNDVVDEAANSGFDTVLASASYTLISNSSVESLIAANSASTAALNLTGNALGQTIAGNAGSNILDGAAGIDTVSYADAAGAVTVSLSQLVQNTGNAGTDTIKNFENVTGSAFADSLTGNTGANTLDGQGGADTMTGLGGNDRYIVDNALDKAIEAAGQGTDTVLASISYTLANNVENLTLTDVGNVNGNGNGLDNTLRGNAGTNTLDGKAGADSMKGLAGDDTYVVDNAGDVVGEAVGQGTDTVLAAITYTLTNNVENLTLTGVGHINATGNGLDNTLRGNAGANTLDGKAGADSMKGLAGDDTYVVDNAGDAIAELAGQGTDTVLAGISYTLTNNVENLTLTGVGHINATGNGLDNTLRGNVGNNRLDGKAGADSMKGLAGDDTYVIDNAGDAITELAGQGTDTVLAGISCTLTNNVENLTLTGVGNINGAGNGSSNIVTGNGGNNILTGGGARDTLTGGAGLDVFKFGSITDSGTTAALRDLITDFIIGSDKIDLADIDASTLVVGNQAFTFIGAAGFSGAAGQLRSVTSASATVISGDINGDSTADFAIGLTGVLALTAGDFIL